jgi:hypothetical protein
MNIKQLVAISLAGVSCATSTMFAQAEDHGHQVPAGLVHEVRLATQTFAM